MTLHLYFKHFYIQEEGFSLNIVFSTDLFRSEKDRTVSCCLNTYMAEAFSCEESFYWLKAQFSSDLFLCAIKMVPFLLYSHMYIWLSLL